MSDTQEQDVRVQRVRISPRYDENDVPLVRLTRTVQSGFGLGVGIALAQLVILGLGVLLFGVAFGSAVGG